MVANPEIDSFGKASEGLGCPGDVSVAVWSQCRVLGAEAIVLLLRIRHVFTGIEIDYEFESLREGHAQDVCGGEAEGRRRRRIFRDEGVGFAIGG